MSKIGVIPQTDRDTARQHSGKATVVQKPYSGWLDGVVATPLLVLAVCGYQVAVLLLKVVNREKAPPPANSTRRGGVGGRQLPTTVTNPDGG
jgi:hypothetical protein